MLLSNSGAIPLNSNYFQFIHSLSIRKGVEQRQRGSNNLLH